MKKLFKKIFNKTANQNNPITSKDNEISLCIDKLVTEALELKDNYTIKLSELELYKVLKKEPVNFKKEVIYVLIHYKNIHFSKKWEKQSYFVNDIFSKLLSSLIRSTDIDFNGEELIKISKAFSTQKDKSFYSNSFPFIPFLTKIEKLVAHTGLTPDIENALDIVFKLISSSRYIYSEEKKILSKIKLIKEGPKQFSVSNSDALGKTILKASEELNNKSQDSFISLLNHYSKGIEKSKPTLKWLKEADIFIKEVNNTSFLLDKMISWIDVVIGLLKEIHKNKSYQYSFISDENLQLLRGAIWSSHLLNDNNLNQSIEELGLWTFKKLPGVGAVSAKLGNSCIYTFSKLPYQDGVSRLTKFRMKIKYPSVQSLITKAIINVAKAEGKTMDQIEELAVQDFNLDENYCLTKGFDIYQGIITIKDSTTVLLTWKNDKDKTIKTVPKYVKDNFPEELKQFKKKLKDIQTNLSAQRSRIEKIFLAKRNWQFSEWKKLYLDNTLLAFFGTKLIWSFTTSKETIHAIPFNGEFLTPKGKIKIDTKITKVELWHPVNAKVKEVQEWRNWLLEQEIKQPFKQAHREVYIVTDAEINTKTYSNRFAAHIIRQHIFNALCRERGWSYQLQGQWDSYNIPGIFIPAWNYKVEFWVDTEGVSDYTNQTGIFDYLQTDQVRFYDANAQVDIEEVPTIVFSELMRDIDLFVGVTSIGADPNWRDGGAERFHEYWTSFSFGNLATSGVERKSLLENLIPKLHIKNSCSFEGNFLVVKGKIRIYKIHMGSGNILMKPNDQYLCIVANRKKEQNVFLPFEGDSTLSTILSKAFMLANDNTIKDKTITSQINRR